MRKLELNLFHSENQFPETWLVFKVGKKKKKKEAKNTQNVSFMGYISLHKCCYVVINVPLEATY